MRISMTAIVVVVVFAIVLFGAKRLPDLARSLGQSMRILKSETRAMRSDDEPDGPARDDGGAATSTVRTIQTAPGASATARPVAEPSAERPAADGDRPH
ncbi:Sec-independent protein translocase subunit TatA [Streptomyces kaniharaensis]|uniref:Sec-independent protein translocase protein TatA n=1 Tax=Streptomyces kaniharaensis TaxID=212423 RepID=A0A6N7KPH3_9ACTN|nr:Sec-independent protein translocase subunit TatA [Streptomyces kaniharaensis]MQS11513.1 Sec-independent protein translocase subunit TatA [Streptomyces kaniharaensis]